MTGEESDDHIAELDAVDTGLTSDGSAEEDWFNDVAQPQFKR
jgi:hypothetical protein